MRIAAITNSRIPSSTANSIQAMKVCDALTVIGHHVHVIAPREAPPPIGEALRAQYGLRRVPDIEWLPSRRFLRRLDFTFAALSAAKRFQAELVYTWLPQAAVIGLRREFPVVLEMHGGVSGAFGAWWLQQFWRMSGRKRMTVTTKPLRIALERSAGFRFPAAEVLLAPNGIDLAPYANLPDPPTARRKLGLQEAPTVGLTGHLYPGRGEELLLEVARRMPEVIFLWAGGTPDIIARMRERQHSAQLANVHITGFVEHAQVPLHQAAADVLIMPYGRSVQGSSGQEIAEVISPMKMFEYMAAGRAIVTADLPTIREVLDEQMAVFCPPGDAAEWEAALRILLSDDAARLVLAERARRHVEGYTWEQRQERILAGLLEGMPA